MMLGLHRLIRRFIDRQYRVQNPRTYRLEPMSEDLERKVLDSTTAGHGLGPDETLQLLGAHDFHQDRAARLARVATRSGQRARLRARQAHRASQEADALRCQAKLETQLHLEAERRNKSHFHLSLSACGGKIAELCAEAEAITWTLDSRAKFFTRATAVRDVVGEERLIGILWGMICELRRGHPSETDLVALGVDRRQFEIAVNDISDRIRPRADLEDVS